MVRVGITGGIGSGKSTVTSIFEVLGIPVYSADAAAKKLMNESGPLKANIIHHFGAAAYTGGQLDRKYLASQVFNDKEKLDLLNSLVHPLTIKDGEEWMQRQTSAYAIKEAALIFESGMEKQFDYIIGVYAPSALRIERAMKRDRISEDEVLSRMSKQMDEETKLKRCDFIINNNNQQAVIPQVMALHQQLLERAGVNSE
jgi:dephospho-CoA kinase